MTENTRKSNGPLPICVVSGFLGAGKTTLLNNIINADHGLRMGVLVNDFGAIDIDSQLIVGVDEDVISLKSGCICCTMRDDFLHAIVKLVKRPDPPEYVLIETSGVSDPASVVTTLMDPALTKVLRVETVLTVVDAAELLALSKDQYDLAEAQIFTADLVVVNKCDLVENEELETVNSTVRSLAPHARLFQTDHGRVPLPIVLGEKGERGRPAQFHARDQSPHEGHDGESSDAHACCGKDASHHHHDECTEHDSDHSDHHHDDHKHHHVHHDSDSLTNAFRSCSYACEAPMDLDKLREALRVLPLSIYRLKGFFHISVAPEQRLLIQVVGSRVSAVEAEPWGERTPRTEVVAIGETATISDQLLASIFEGCIAQNNVTLGKGWIGRMLFWRRGKHQVSTETRG